MNRIEIDFDVYKALTALRGSEDDTYNMVLRRLLDLPAAPERRATTDPTATAEWFGYGVTLPVGTQLRTTYKKVERFGIVRADGLEVDGTLYPSLSAAAIGVVGQNTNGWNFWRFLDQDSNTWKPMMALR